MPAANLAYLVVLEARRGGLPWLAGAAIVLSVGLAAFLSRIALTEGALVQASAVAASLRLCAAFLIAAHVASSVLREVNDKGLELFLALPLARPVQYLGRLAGFVACGLALAAAFALPLLAWAPPAAVALWGLSLALELALIAAAALFFALALSQLVPAIAATAGFYFLARSIGAMQAIATGPLAVPSARTEFARWTVDLVALLVPRLDQATQTAWLLYGTPEPRAYLTGLAGMLIYTLLLTAAGLFDFQRRSL